MGYTSSLQILTLTSFDIDYFQGFVYSMVRHIDKQDLGAFCVATSCIWAVCRV